MTKASHREVLRAEFLRTYYALEAQHPQEKPLDLALVSIWAAVLIAGDPDCILVPRGIMGASPLRPLKYAGCGRKDAPWLR